MAEEKKAAGSAGAARWIIIAALAGLGIYLYMRSNKQKAAATSAAAEGDTTANDTTAYDQYGNAYGNYPGVDTYDLSGTYSGPYTPYNVINNGVTAPAGSMGSSTQQSITDALQNGGNYISTVNNTNTA